MVGLAYAVTAPLIAPIALLFFATAYITWRYAVIYIYERQYESGAWRRQPAAWRVFPFPPMHNKEEQEAREDA